MSCSKEKINQVGPPPAASQQIQVRITPEEIDKQQQKILDVISSASNTIVQSSVLLLEELKVPPGSQIKVMELAAFKMGLSIHAHNGAVNTLMEKAKQNAQRGTSGILLPGRKV